MSIANLEVLRSDMKKCVRCSLCKIVPMPTVQQTKFITACPPVDEYHFHAYSGGGISVMALSLLDGRIQFDSDLAKIVSACTTCGMCDVSCKFIMAAERQEIIIALKEALADHGLAPLLAEEPPPSLPHWASGLNLKILPKDKADILLIVGSESKYNEQHVATARKLAKLLLEAKVDFGILDGYEPPVGIKAYSTGHRKEFSEFATQMVQLINNSGAKTIITLCGEDLGMLRSKYPHYGFDFQAKVYHVSEFLLKLMKKKKLKFKHLIPKTVTYHDPCYLGRQSEHIQQWDGEERQTHGVMKYFVPPKPINFGSNGVYDEPRSILRAIPGLQFVEMHRIREYAYCCGAGGGVPETHPNVAKSAALQRLEEAQDVQAELLVTSCQNCRLNFTRWSNENNIPTTDIVDLVYQATGLEES